MKSSPPSKSASGARNRSVRRRVSKQRSPRDWTLALAVLLFVATVALYYPVHSHPFANFDDGSYVFANPHVQSGLQWDTVKWAFTSIGTVTPDVPDWHPLAWLSHALDTQLFGPDAAGPHDVNLVFHALNVVLLFWVLRRATGAVGRSAMVAALFAVHPINVESVAWISERKNLLSMLFFLLALGAYRWYASTPPSATRRTRVARYVVVAALFALGLMSKPQVITLPFVLLLWDYWPLRRMFPTREVAKQQSSSAELPAKNLSWLILEKLPLLAMSVISAVITVRSQLAIGSIDADKRLSFGIRLGNAIVSYARYLGKAVWPSRLALFYPHPGTSLPMWQVVSALAVLLIITGFVLVARHRRYLLVGWFWFLGTLVPMIGLVQLNKQAMADRYAYLTFVGLFILICWGVADGAAQLGVSPVWMRSASVVTLLVLAAVTYRQLGFWSDNQTLWSHTLEVTRDNYLAEDIVGSALMDQGQPEEALPHFQAAARINPSDPEPPMAIGAYDQQRGNLREAIDQYKKAIALTDGAVAQSRALRATTFARMGSAYRGLGEFEPAKESFHRALEINPNDGSSWIALGIVTQLSGDLPGAVEAYSHGVKLQPTDVGYLLLARALDESGRPDQAEAAKLQGRAVSNNFTRAEATVDAVFASRAGVGSSSGSTGARR